MTMRVRTQNDLTWQRVLDRYLLFKQAQGLAERSIEDIRYHVALFFERACAQISDCEILRSAVLSYFASTASLSPVTFNVRRKVLKGFFSWAKSEGMIPGDPLEGIKRLKEDELPRSVEEAVLRRLLTLPDKTTFAGLRDSTLILLTMDTGIRPREALNLRIEDFSLKTLDVAIPASVAKTRVSRTLPISPITAEAVRRVIESRYPQWGTSVSVFCTEDGQTMNHNAWDRRMSIYSKMLGAKVRPYDLRHSFALMYIRQGGNAFSLQKTLGHTTLTMTKRYVALTQQDLKQQHSLASPLRSLLPKRNRIRKVHEKDI
jgi:integrase